MAVLESTVSANDNQRIDADQWLEYIKSKMGFWKTSIPVAELNTALSKAKVARFVERFSSPRRFVLSLVALGLAFAWLGQAIVGVLFRSSASITSLMNWIPLSLTGYFVWNLIKFAGQKPVEPFHQCQRFQITRHEIALPTRAGLRIHVHNALRLDLL